MDRLNLSETIQAAPDDKLPALLLETHAAQAQIVARLASGGIGTTDTDDEFLSPKELAERIPYSEATLRGFTQNGTFREGVEFTHKRRRVIFFWSAVRHWLQSVDADPPNPTEPAAFPSGRTRP